MKKFLALAICLCLVLSLLAGCGGSEIEYYEDDTAAAETAGTEETETEAAAATGYDTYDPDTVVAVINGTDVTWQEYYYWLSYYVAYVQQIAAQYGAVLSGWDAYELSSENTNAQVVLLNAQYAVEQYHVMTTEAEAMGIVLTEEDEETILSAFEQSADYNAGDGDGVCTEEEAEAFEELLAMQYVDREFFNYLNEVSLLNENAFVSLYGEEGALCSDEDVAAYVEEYGLMAAKHILLMTIDSTTGEALSDEEIAEKLATAEDLSAQLEAVADDQEALEALFDELMAQYTEDTGYAYYPDGYIFGEGEMVEEFEDAVAALDENYGLSGVVESDYGYHVILRLPVDPEAVAGVDSYGYSYTLRYLVASELFGELMDSWMEAADVQWNEGFEDLDIAAVFG